MKKGKRIYQGAFLCLLIVLAGVSTGYSAWMVHSLRGQTNDLSFIDLAAKSVESAGELLDRLSNFQTMLTVSIIALAVFAVLFALWLLVLLRGRKRSRAAAEPVPYAEEGGHYECPNCHRVYDMPIAFCGVCGAKMTED